jgi:glutathione synthase/RimK-type ligase-like ATP-grasp enzyme
MSILFINGTSDDDSAGIMGPTSKGALKVDLGGTCNIREPLDSGKNSFLSLLIFGSSFKQPRFAMPKSCSLIVNQISDPDTHFGALGRCRQLCGRSKLPVINAPENVMKTSRDGISYLLKEIPGVTVPRIVRAEPHSPDEIFGAAEAAGLPYPFIVRQAGRHGGEGMTLIHGRSEIGKLHKYPFDGSKYYLVEFMDLRDEAGVYHKQRIAVIDGRPIVRHVLFRGDWVINVDSREFMEKHPEYGIERELIVKTETEQLPKVRPAIDEITRRLGLELYGIDGYIDKAGQFFIFEVNSAMNLLTNAVPGMPERVPEIKDRVRQMLSKYSGEPVY